MTHKVAQFKSYAQFKSEFDQEICKQTDGFIRMGYLLKVARDTEILRESGYKTIAEFAGKEYKLTEDVVSRMIAINDRYSEEGYSDRIADRYRGFGTSLLADMLKLSDAVVEALPQGTTREEIRELKKEIKEERKITDLEVMMEQPEAGHQDLDNNLTKVLHRYYYENSSEYSELHESIIRNCLTPKKAMELLAPAGIAVKTVRIAGIGKLMLSIKGENQELELVNLRSDARELFSWASCVVALMQLGGNNDGARKDWEIVYGEPYPETKEIAPAQVEVPAKKEKEAKPGKVGQKKVEPLKKTTAVKAAEPAKPEPEKVAGRVLNEPEELKIGHGEVVNKHSASVDIVNEGNHVPEVIEMAPVEMDSVIIEVDRGDVTEIIENPYQDLRRVSLMLIEQTREHLESSEFVAAYNAGKELMSALENIMDIKQQQDQQIDGQMDIEDFVS